VIIHYLPTTLGSFGKAGRLIFVSKSIITRRGVIAVDYVF
jgi:hypothetical protein